MIDSSALDFGQLSTDTADSGMLEVAGSAATSAYSGSMTLDLSTGTGYPGFFSEDLTLVVPSGATLTLAPGTVVKALGSANGVGNNLSVQGTLDAVGTAASPVTFTSVNDNSVGGSTGTGTPKPADWAGIELGSLQASSQFDYVVFEYASVAIHVDYLDALPIENSVFSYDTAAITVDGTSDNDPALAALDCVPPYLSFIDASTDWFGSTGFPTPSIDLSSVIGAILPSGYSNLFSAGISMVSLEGASVGDNTVPWSIYSCPELLIPPIPVTPVNIPTTPIYPLDNPSYEEK